MSDKEHTPYDDLFPLSIWVDELLDRHNDRVATFEKTFEERQRIIDACNNYERLLRENNRLREALEKIQNFKVKLFDKNLTMMDVILHDKRVAKEALESPLEKQGEGEAK